MLHGLCVVVIAPHFKSLYMYILHICGGLVILCRVVLDVHPLDPCRIIRAPLYILDIEHVNLLRKINAQPIYNPRTTVKEFVFVLEGGHTLEDGGVRTIRLEDSQANVLISSSSWIAAETAL